ncbi:hypothetical protein ACYZFV_01395 [Serratia ureilytica]
MDKFREPEQFDAEVEIHDGEPFAVWAPAVNGSHVKAEVYFALLAELEAKDKRIAELEAIRADASEVFKEIGNELGCDPDNESIMMAIDDLKKDNTSLRDQRAGLVQAASELGAKLATPVRLPKRWDVSGQVNPPRIVEVQFEQQNRTHDQCAEAIRAAGFTVVVEGVE